MRFSGAHYPSLSSCFTFIILYLQKQESSNHWLRLQTYFFLCSTTILGFFVNSVRRNVGEKTLVGWVFRGGRSGFSKNTFSAYVYSQSNILSSINFPWNHSKTSVSVDFVVVRIRLLLPARENDLFVPENFKVLFWHNQLIIAYWERI